MLRRVVGMLCVAGALAGPLAAAAGAQDATYRLGSRSTITYFVEHPMHHVQGVTHAVEGRIAIAHDHLVTPLQLTLPLLSFNSGNGNRDSNAAFILDVPHFPLATLDVRRFSETSRRQAGSTWILGGIARGNLTLRGVSHPIDVPLTATLTPALLTVDGSFHVSLTAYHIERPSLLFRPINDDVRVLVHAVAIATGRPK